ncbi:bifunctional alpha/beta hydrolase/OsmC family protein [Granulosicoccus sp. 3-233]|uniref:bifunctional alpha/beta hydrolase/OsmC family protein n=1 Tax=Granulosicoccus sp. 3-233 TaxID=3417969 RepID=UPI003D333A90
MPARRKFEFTGSQGAPLAALLETPDQEPIATALFAHCFTCGKDIAAASRISRALVKRGYAVMRFDFTGLGNSDGDFSNTNFSSNVQDLVAAADHLRADGLAPSLLIGHSLGGTAVLTAAHDIPECKGIVTIGSPADARHVSAQFSCDIDTIEREGEAQVNLAGRQFTIRKQFLDDINQTSEAHIARLKAALLIMHSPIDATVNIAEAERIYKAARHPKSFISLDNTDHLLTKAADSEYVADMIAAWALRQVRVSADNLAPARPKVSKGEVSISERNRKFMLDIHTDDHQWIADEPSSLGGNNAGPDPYEHLLASVGACTAMSLRMYAGRKQWPLDNAEVVLRHSRDHVKDCEDCDEKPMQIDVIDRDITLHGELDDGQRQRLMAIADRCPVHRTLTGNLSIRTREVPA